jgi:hypothetical protein
MLLLQAASGSPANPVAQEQYETYCAQVGGPSPQNPPPAPAQPTCGIELFARPVPNSETPAYHTYLLVTDSAWGNNGYLIEGGPTGSPVLSDLIGYDNSAPGQGLAGSNPSQPGNIFLGADNAQNACSLIQQIIAAVDTYDVGPLATYNFLAPPGTYNSNSFTSTLDNQFGLWPYFNSPSSMNLWAPGWGKLVPEL